MHKNALDMFRSKGARYATGAILGLTLAGCGARQGTEPVPSGSAASESARFVVQGSIIGSEVYAGSKSGDDSHVADNVQAYLQNRNRNRRIGESVQHLGLYVLHESTKHYDSKIWPFRTYCEHTVDNTLVGGDLADGYKPVAIDICTVDSQIGSTSFRYRSLSKLTTKIPDFTGASVANKACNVSVALEPADHTSNGPTFNVTEGKSVGSELFMPSVKDAQRRDDRAIRCMQQAIDG